MRREKPLKIIADADRGSDDPDGACGPGGARFKTARMKGDDAVDHEPSGAVTGAELKNWMISRCLRRRDSRRGNEGEGRKGVERMEDEVDAGEGVDDADEQLPEAAAGGMVLKAKMK